jgi:hypothetical protein
MRSALVPHLNQLVLGKGWIDSWEDFKSTQTRRVCVKQPTIKIADKHTLFANQQVISTEHHINLFIPYNLLEQYEAQFITHSPISFSGEVVEYQRQNGSVDYGISANPQHRLNLDLERLSLALVDIGRENPFASSTLAFYEHTALPQVRLLQERLEQAGNALPTFELTYGQYKEMLEEMIETIKMMIAKRKHHTRTRDYRRQQKGRQTILQTLKSI